ncbi:hypothetical protein Vadar_008843 [Vaccinium darrowii]|uniref:Uncharacterized protein n=1 Tax=Vaccinium darrowii TaxID=229202 RepID=A0ACB7XP81_9ERIC|nr:hypothetical protein Vadar_008843 [Vaccinium darrowii]
MKEVSGRSFWVIILLFFVCGSTCTHALQQGQWVFCIRPKCFLKLLRCPAECPMLEPAESTVKACEADCSRTCSTMCRSRVPNCNGLGALCYDPRFVGGDGVIFYFRGRSNEHFSLVSDTNLQINARFIGFRPKGRASDYTWIQALGILFGSHTFTLEATKATTWDNTTDHLRFSYDGNEVFVPENHLSSWNSPDRNFQVERISSKNSVIFSIPDVMEIAVKVMPVTKEDDKMHNYQIPSNDCFAHLQVQFKFFSLSPKVEGVLGITYQPDFKNPAKKGVSMPVLGGEDKYRTTSLLSADCKSCLFSPANIADWVRQPGVDYGTLDCTGGSSRGNGIVCKK